MTDRHVTTDGPLHGLRVIELAQVLAGPFCGQYLADAGADVVKVEPPAGDGTRHWGPPWLADCEPREGYPGDSAYYACCNRNKRTMAVDLKTAAGRAVVRRLIRDADVVVENGNRATMRQWGLTYEDCRVDNPGLIWASISGYGVGGPDDGLPGYDFAIQAGAGLMSITGDVDGPPMKVGVPVSDLATAATATIGILSALAGRQRSGEGRHIEVSLLETQVSWLANVASNHLVSGNQPGRYGNAHANVVPYELFPAADREIALAVGNDKQFARLAEALGRPEWASDPRFASNTARVANRDTLVPLLRDVLATRTADEWLRLLRGHRVPVELVRTVAEVMEHPQIAHRGLVREVAHPVAGPIRMLGSPITFDGGAAVTPTPPPMFSEHTREVLVEAGFSESEIEDLVALGAVVEAELPRPTVQGATT